MTAHWLWWPDVTLSFDVMLQNIRKSSIRAGEKMDLIEKLQNLKIEWGAAIEARIQQIAETLHKTETPETTESQTTSQPQDEPILVFGRPIASYLPSGDQFTIVDEIYRYKTFSTAEFKNCKYSNTYTNIFIIDLKDFLGFPFLADFIG